MIDADTQATYRETCRKHGGVEDSAGPHQFEPASLMIPALREFGATIPLLTDEHLSRKGRLALSQAGYIVIHIARPEDDAAIKNFIGEGKWHRHVTDARPPVDAGPLDEWLRYLVAPGESDGLAVSIGYYLRSKSSGTWRLTEKTDIKSVMASHHVPSAQRDPLCGQVVLDPWLWVKLPFQPEYPGGRQWNFGAPQYRYAPSAGGPHPTWDLVLSHCGQDLDVALSTFDWNALAANPDERLKLSDADKAWLEKPTIKTGGDYLLHWAACLLREPFESLPYLFFWSREENTGKSTYHEALALLMTGGVVSADRALTNSNDFNGELANGILAYVEEKDISKSPGARNKLKDWVTSPTLSVRKMRTDTYRLPNTLHFVQTANNRSACVVVPGDTRIVVMYVPKPPTDIPKGRLMGQLRAEAPHFMRKILDLQLPPVLGRLRLPVVENSSKAGAAEDSLGDYPHAIADFMEGRREWKGTVTELAARLGPGNWPYDRRRAKVLFDDAATFFKSRQITIEHLPKNRDGFPVRITHL